ncbi:porin [Primorskyibacter sp. S87]|uniref:porin n=1 Tax=Primorskyibacter sp. S87 TaxID=3415126 RepID=UPI003C7DE6E9
MKTVAKPFAHLCLCLAIPGGALASETKYPIAGETTFRYYGWFHFANQSVDDGVETTSNIVDVTNANTRFGFFIEGESPLSFQFESALGFRQSQKTSQTNTPDFWNWDRTFLRQVQMIFDDGYGTFRLGQGSMATDGAAESDLGSTVVVAKSTIPESHGGFFFRDAAGVLTAVNIGAVFSNFDGGRRLRVRYDTPRFNGLSVAVAYGKEVLKSGVNDRFYDFALRYDAETGAYRFKAALGMHWVNAPSLPTARGTVGSVSLLHSPTGLNLSLAAGKQHDTGADYVYLKGGWNADFWSVGPTKLIAEGYWGDDHLRRGSRSQMWGLALLQEFEQQNLEAYAGYRFFTYSDRAAQYQDIGAWQIGARWRY